jgi:hypothetical protein
VLEFAFIKLHNSKLKFHVIKFTVYCAKIICYHAEERTIATTRTSQAVRIAHKITFMQYFFIIERIEIQPSFYCDMLNFCEAEHVIIRDIWRQGIKNEAIPSLVMTLSVKEKLSLAQSWAALRVIQRGPGQLDLNSHQYLIHISRLFYVFFT